MIYAVFLCDKQWKIRKIQQCRPEVQLKEEKVLTDMVSEKEELQNLEEEKAAVELTFAECKLPAVIQSYQEGILVILCQVESSEEFLEFNNAYPKYQEWAKDCMFGLFHDEYYMIQEMNNRLVDAQRKLARSNRKLEQASRRKTRFLANMSHDIRTPMNAIVGLAELMQHNLKEPDLLKTYISKLKSSSKYLLDLINDILELSKIETGSMALREEPMDIGNELEQIITIIRPQIEDKKQELSIDGKVEWRYIVADSIHLRQVLMNVLSNAVKYTPQGGKIHFEVSDTRTTEQKGEYQFIIEDNGIGMSQEFAEHIFEPFSREEESVSEIQGTGLGMAITKSIVDAMGGIITVKSAPGQGSRFEITFSFVLCQKEEVQREEGFSDGQSKEHVNSIEGKRFLCAEDNELNAEILVSMMELEGAECTVYENGRLLVEAFEKIKPGEYDVVLMDVQMPVMDGYEATKQIRNSKNPLGRTIPIIAMSANAFREDISKSLDAGMNAHISKPIDMKVLCETVNKELIR